MLTLKRLYLALLAVLLFFAVNPPFFIEAFELKIYDLMVRYSAPGRPDPRVIIIGIDQKSLDTFGRWPWPRDVIGRVIEKLAIYGARVTALDITFASEVDDAAAKVVEELAEDFDKLDTGGAVPEFREKLLQARSRFTKDESLARSISKAGNVVTGYFFHGKQGEVDRDAGSVSLMDESIYPFRIKLSRRSEDSRGAHIWFNVAGVEPNIPLVQKASRASGFLNAWPDSDGVIRSHPMVIESKGSIYPSLALVSAALYRGAWDNDVQVVFGDGMLEGVSIAGSFLPLDPYGRLSLKYLGEDSTFPVISAADVLTRPDDDRALVESLKDKIAIIGATAAQIYDLRVTPLGYTAGVEVQANAISVALTGVSISALDWQRLYDAALTLVIGLFLLYALPRLRVFVGLMMIVTMLAGLVRFNYWMLAENHLWLYSVIPGLAIIVGFVTITTWEYISEQESKRFIKDAFGRYLSVKIINQIVQDPSLLKLGGEKRVMTAFFSDVAGFTTISEQLSPAQLVSLLNEYLSQMSRIIHELDGTVDKYEGDAIIAFWGAPVRIDNHAQLCVLAAIRQQRKLVQMREKWREQGRDELFVRMGINTGPMVVGNMGSKERMDYTIMGDSVNLAARLEWANKYYGTYLMISEFTYELVKDNVMCRELDIVRLPGKKEAIRQYEALEEMENVSEAQRRFVWMFRHALATFRRMDFMKASRLFESCEKLRPEGDATCKLYIKRCAQLASAPPPEDWDRVYELSK